MRTVPTWVDKVHDQNKAEQCIYSLCFNPHGSQLIVAAGQIVLVYSCITGSVIQILKGHKDNVYCVNYSYDSNRFASGGADKTVIIWNSSLEPLLKYSHNEAVQCLEFNSITNVLVSCANSEFFFWSLEQKSVQKFKISSKINCCSWSSDGQYLALGLATGNVSIRNIYGDEKCFIERENGNSVPIWSLAFSPKKEENEKLCLTDWNQKLSFYSVDGIKLCKEKVIGFEVLSVAYMSKGDFILAAGCNKQCVLLNYEGINLGNIGEEQQSWIWCCKANPVAPFIVFGCHDGTVAYFQIIFSTVHGLYKEKYAFRENMTDVVIRHLITNKRVEIKCRDWVKKIAIYKDKLAVLLRTKVIVYEQDQTEPDQIHYIVKEKLKKSFDCNLLILCSNNLILCQEKYLQCFTFDGVNIAQWQMNDVARYIKVVGGAPGNEGLIVGLADGRVFEIFISNPFPILLMKSKTAILCLDLNLKNKLVVINENKQCIIYDVVNNKIIHQEENILSAVWNSMYEDMLCYSGNDMLNIKVGNCPSHQMKLSGYVVGAYGAKVFSLNGSNVVTTDIPLSAPMYQCLEKQCYKEAYKIACLGVPECDWKSLAFWTLENFELEIAIKAFTRIKDLQYLELIYEYLGNKSEQSKESFMGNVSALQGKFKNASKWYQKAGENYKALSMYTDIRMFDLAQEFVRSEDNSDKKHLIRKKAEWAKKINKPKAAAEMYLSAGDVVKAIDISIEHCCLDTLINLGKNLDINEKEGLQKIADFLSEIGEFEQAIEINQKLNRFENILQLFINTKNWEAALSLIADHPDLETTLYIPYAQWLVENDKYIDAQQAFYKAGKPEEATKVLEILIENAIDEERFDDASYYNWLISRHYLDQIRNALNEEVNLSEKFHFHDKLADIYYAYNIIQRYLEEPFTSYQPEVLFNMARFLLNETKGIYAKGVTQFSILYSLAKQAKNLGAFKIARQALDYLQNFRIPTHFQDFVDMASVMIRAKPYHDNEDLLMMCYCCSSYNPLVISSRSATGNICLHCKQPFIFSFVTFEVLPLIEFQLEEGISDSEAKQLLESSSEVNKNSTINNLDSNIQNLVIDDVSKNSTDLFTTALMDLESRDDKYSPVIVDRETLRSMNLNLVLICEWPKPFRYRYYRNLVPELQITACSSCFKVFHMDDYEMEILQKHHCPFCRTLKNNQNMQEE